MANMDRESAVKEPGVEEAEDRKFKLQYAYPLPRDFEEEFEKVCLLKAIKDWLDEYGRDELQIRLGEIVYAYRGRLNDTVYKQLVQQGAIPQFRADAGSDIESNYFSRIKECIRASEGALKDVETIIKTFALIDIKHIEQIRNVAHRLPYRTLSNVLDIDLLKYLSDVRRVLAVLTFSLQAATGITTQPRGKGAPGWKHFLPASELVMLWEEITGTKVVTPRGGATGKMGKLESDQPSTEFVRLGLRMIDPKASLANAMTAIRSVMQVRQRNESPSLEGVLSELVKDT